MSIPFHASWRTRAVAGVESAGALATVAAVAPTSSVPSSSPASRDTGSVEAAEDGSATQTSAAPDPSAAASSAPLSEQVLIAASLDEVETAPDPVEAAEVGQAASAPDPAPVRSVWDRVADCEAGEWTGDGGFVTASANWSATAGLFEGGLQFHPDTWDGYRDPDMPGAAYEATREQQIAVAERVLAEQGWKAWPVCSRKLGLR